MGQVAIVCGILRATRKNYEEWAANRCHGLVQDVRERERCRARLGSSRSKTNGTRPYDTSQLEEAQ